MAEYGPPDFGEIMEAFRPLIEAQGMSMRECLASPDAGLTPEESALLAEAYDEWAAAHD